MKSIEADEISEISGLLRYHKEKINKQNKGRIMKGRSGTCSSISTKISYFSKEPESFPTSFSLGTCIELYANVCTRSGGLQTALLELEYKGEGTGEVAVP